MSAGARRTGLTLIEMVVVVTILTILAGVLLPQISGVREGASETATKTSMLAIRAAIIGAERGDPAFSPDIGSLPATMRDLFIQPAGAPIFDRFTGRGWRGPYVRDAIGRYAINNQTGFLSAYGLAGDPAVLDGWGHPIVIQVPTAATDPDERSAFTRLVSAGPDGHIDTPRDGSAGLYPVPASRGDDVVLFLLRADVPP